MGLQPLTPCGESPAREESSTLQKLVAAAGVLLVTFLLPGGLLMATYRMPFYKLLQKLPYAAAEGCLSSLMYKFATCYRTGSGFQGGWACTVGSDVVVARKLLSIATRLTHAYRQVNSSARVGGGLLHHHKIVV